MNKRSSVVDSIEPPLEGYLVKMGKYVKSWNKRWVCVDGNSIKYFTHMDKQVIKGSILIKDILEIKLADKHDYSSNNLSSSTSSTLNNSNNNVHLVSGHLNSSLNHSNSSFLGNSSSSSDSVNNSIVNSNSNFHHMMMNSGNSISNTSSGNLSNNINNINNNNNNVNNNNNNNNINNNSNNSSNNLGNVLNSSNNNVELMNSSGTHSNIRPLSQSLNNNTNNNINNNNNNNHHHHHWIFSIKIPDRVYLFRADSEVGMHYWVQGIKNILVEMAMNENKMIENKRHSKKLQMDFNEVLTNEIIKVQTESHRLKKYHKHDKEEIRKELNEFKTWTLNFNEIFIKYQTQVKYNDVQYKKTIKHLETQLQTMTSNCNCNNNPNNPNNPNNNNPNNIYQNANNFNNNTNSNNNNNDNSIHHHSKHLSTSQLPLYTQNYIKQSQVSPNGMALWFPDESSKNCSMCSVTFTFFKRRHHCRRCGLLFCGKCSSNKREVKGYCDKVRVCESCCVSIGLSYTNHSSKPNTLSMS